MPCRVAAVERTRPLALAAVFAILGLVIGALPRLGEASTVLFVVAVVVGVPLALAVGALRYPVWDLDRFVVAAIVYGLLAVLITGVYTGVAVGFAALANNSLKAASLRLERGRTNPDAYYEDWLDLRALTRVAVDRGHRAGGCRVCARS